MFFDKETIAEVKESINIVEVIGEVVSLTKSGRNYLGLCPFHEEKTPSFNVLEDKQFYHCFGCGKSGDVFEFIEEYHQVSFDESMKILADRANISLESFETRIAPSKNNPNQSLYDIHKAASDFYHALLMTTKIGEKARRYLYNRGLTDKEINHFNIGLSLEQNDYLYQSLKDKYDEQTILDSGLFHLSERNAIYDTFTDRIMFPLTDELGHVIAFSGRNWQEKISDKPIAKYKNSRATRIFNKSYELYHLDQAKASIKKEKEVYLFEGFMDVIAAYRSGITNAVASMGTALTKEHITHLKKFTHTVVLAYDGDSAGQHAIQKSLSSLEGQLQTFIVRFPHSLDPDEYLKKYSTEEFQYLLTKGRMSDIEYQIDYLKPENSNNIQAEIAYVEQITKIIAKSPSITAQNTYINMVADLLPDFDYFQVEEAVNQERNQGYSHPPTSAISNQRNHSITELPYNQTVSPLKRAEEQLLSRMITHDYVLNDYKNRPDFAFATNEFQMIFDLLKKEGEITRLALEEMPENVQKAYYEVQSLNLPSDIGHDELKEVEIWRKKYLTNHQNILLQKKIREKAREGNKNKAINELEKLISQKRKME